jgi:hypothetical protein
VLAATPSFTVVVRVRLINGRTLWVEAVEDDNEEWLRANGRGRPILLSKVPVKAVEPA